MSRWLGPPPFQIRMTEVSRAGWPAVGLRGPEPQHVGQRQAGQAQHARLQETPPRDAVATAIFAAGDLQHGSKPSEPLVGCVAKHTTRSF